jgi:Uma2 family endonuclease
MAKRSITWFLRQGCTHCIFESISKEAEISDALLKEERRWTYRDYREWDLKEGERYEIIYGVAYAMSAPNAYHQSILMALAARFYNFLEGKPCKVYPAPYDVRLFYEEDESDDMVVSRTWR